MLPLQQTKFRNNLPFISLKVIYSESVLIYFSLPISSTDGCQPQHKTLAVSANITMDGQTGGNRVRNTGPTSRGVANNGIRDAIVGQQQQQHPPLPLPNTRYHKHQNGGAPPPESDSENEYGVTEEQQQQQFTNNRARKHIGE